MNTRKLSAFAAKYKYVLIILLAGLILLLLPTGSRTKAKTAQAAAVSEQTQPQTIQAEEQRLTTLLQQINGAGQVQVLLSYRCSAERELATDDSGEPTIISAGGGAQEAVELKTVSPQYLGAVVVCDGADSPQVQLAVTQAVAQFTGLSTDHISVLRKQPDSQSKNGRATMKKTKRNIAIIVVLLFVCAAIYFNWSYNTQWGKADAEMAAAEDAATAAVKAEEEAAAASASASDDYFAKARLTRQQSRDEALSLLKSASTAEGASQATIDSAMSAISAMASDSMTETQIENLLLAKDFSECVVYITDEGITVAVPAPADGLSTAQVATITDTIVKETDYTAPQIKVIEVKADAQDAQ